MSVSFVRSGVLVVVAAAFTLLFSTTTFATTSKVSLSDEMLAQAQRILHPDQPVAPADDPERGGPVTLRVGAGCTYATIQAAIDAAPNTASGAIIRIRTGTYTENLFIGTKNIDLIGGHSSCTASEPTNRTTINGADGTQSAVTFFVSTGGGQSSRSLMLRRLTLINGSGNLLSPGGGLTVLSSSGILANVTIDDVIIGLNAGLRGGGVSLIQTGSTGGGIVTMLNTVLNVNSVSGDNPHGGGLYCNGDFQVLKIGGGIVGNTAGTAGSNNARGGGVYLDECDLTWFAQNEGSGEGRLRNNTSHGGGGGLYATGGAEIFLSGSSFTLFGNPSSTRPLAIEGNQAMGSGADGRGGGIWAEDATVSLQATWLQENNSQSGNGGAVAATGGSVVTINREVGNTTCHTNVECSRISNNRAGDTGGAVYVRDAGSAINIDATVIRNNASIAGSGATLFASQDGHIRVVNSLITRGSGPVGLPASPSGDPNFTFWLSAGSSIDVLFSTVADSEPNTAMFRFGSTSTTLILRSSILHEQNGANLALISSGITPAVDSDCMMWHSLQLEGLGGAGMHTRNILGNPQFINRDGGNFRLAMNSAARDYCDSSTAGMGPPPARDLVTQTRGIDSGGIVQFGLYDLGAFEMRTDVIFSDRFQ